MGLCGDGVSEGERVWELGWKGSGDSEWGGRSWGAFKGARIKRGAM